MPFENRPGQGALFKNRDHEKNPKSPNLKGSALIEISGETIELEIAAWTRESDKAGKWLSLTVRPKGDRQIRQHFDVSPPGKRTKPADIAQGAPVDDDVPF